MDTKRTKNIIKRIPSDQSILIRGRHGIGKSSVVFQAAAELEKETGHKYTVVDFRLSQNEVGDVKGLPMLDKEASMTRYLKSWWWPRDPDSYGILFLDELNRAQKDVLQAVFELCLDHRLDGEFLPKNWRVIAAINADEDYDVSDLDPALLDRFAVIPFEPSQKDWTDWASDPDQGNIHPSIIRFVSQRNEFLDPPGAGKIEVGKVYPSRRSWHRLDELFKSFGGVETLDEVDITNYASLWVGIDVACAYSSFYLHEYMNLRSEDILNNFKEVKPRVKKVVAQMEAITAITTSLLNHLKQMAKDGQSISASQAINVRDFLRMIPRDLVASTWKELIGIPEHRTEVNKFLIDPDFKDFITTIWGSKGKAKKGSTIEEAV